MAESLRTRVRFPPPPPLKPKRGAPIRCAPFWFVECGVDENPRWVRRAAQGKAAKRPCSTTSSLSDGGPQGARGGTPLVITVARVFPPPPANPKRHRKVAFWVLGIIYHPNRWPFCVCDDSGFTKPALRRPAISTLPSYGTTRQRRYLVGLACRCGIPDDKLTRLK